MIKKFKLDNKLAIVTGGSGLLGKEHCIALLELGARVIILEKNILEAKKFCESFKLTKYRDFITFYKADITKISEIKKISKLIIKKFKTIDILINNAANNPKISKKKFSNLKNFNIKDWNADIEVGLTGSLNCSIVFGHIMADNNKGVILNISSDLSTIAPDQRLYNDNKEYSIVKPISYSVVKTGLIGMTKYLSTYWHHKNIRVNALSPGGVYNNHDKKFYNKIKKLIPLNRMASIDEYKGAIQFLCTDASSYMTGQNIVIDGGRTII